MIEIQVFTWSSLCHVESRRREVKSQLRLNSPSGSNLMRCRLKVLLHRSLFCSDRTYDRNAIWTPLTQTMPTSALSLSVPLWYVGLSFYVCGRFSTQSFFYHFFGVGLPAYLSNHNLFLREHIFVGFNKFPSLVYWCTIIHHHRPQGPTLFRRVR